MRWSVGGGVCMPLRMSALGASAKAAPAKPSRPASRLADSSSDLKRDIAALLLSLENGRHAMFRRASLYVIPITLLREAPSPLPPFGATDNLGLLEDRRNPKWGKLRVEHHDGNHRGGAGHRGAGAGEQRVRAACGGHFHHRHR